MANSLAHTPKRPAANRPASRRTRRCRSGRAPAWPSGCPGRSSLALPAVGGGQPAEPGQHLDPAEAQFEGDLFHLRVAGIGVAGNQPRIVRWWRQQVARAQVTRLQPLAPGHPVRRQQRALTRQQHHLGHARLARPARAPGLPPSTSRRSRAASRRRRGWPRARPRLARPDGCRPEPPDRRPRRCRRRRRPTPPRLPAPAPPPRREPRRRRAGSVGAFTPAIVASPAAGSRHAARSPLCRGTPLALGRCGGRAASSSAPKSARCGRMDAVTAAEPRRPPAPGCRSFRRRWILRAHLPLRLQPRSPPRLQPPSPLRLRPGSASRPAGHHPHPAARHRRGDGDPGGAGPQPLLLPAAGAQGDHRQRGRRRTRVRPHRA